ncbi:GL22830 [Drosophila persimilis]|uniref:GL22830 n=1 Tax=Drosophila persimilis TaxID=7234 RepID=B4GZK5_DROPE|nr:GL22830 [Drosophila persimilis]
MLSETFSTEEGLGNRRARLPRADPTLRHWDNYKDTPPEEGCPAHGVVEDAAQPKTKTQFFLLRRSQKFPLEIQVEVELELELEFEMAKEKLTVARDATSLHFSPSPNLSLSLGLGFSFKLAAHKPETETEPETG